MGYAVTDCRGRLVCYIDTDGEKSILMKGVNVVETDEPIFTETDHGIYFFESQQDCVLDEVIE